MEWPSSAKGTMGEGRWFASSRVPNEPKAYIPPVTCTFSHSPKAQPRAFWKLQAVHRSWEEKKEEEEWKRKRRRRKEGEGGTRREREEKEKAGTIVVHKA